MLDFYGTVFSIGRYVYLKQFKFPINFKSFIVKIILLKMQVPKDANFLNSVLMFNFFCSDA